jgi:hypothetical protein
MTLHELKTHSVPFNDMWQSRKSFELRKNDRGFAQDDVLLLREYDPPDAIAHTGYSGRAVIALVVHLIEGPIYGLEAGYVCMSIKVLTRCTIGEGWKKS